METQSPKTRVQITGPHADGTFLIESSRGTWDHYSQCFRGFSLNKNAMVFASFSEACSELPIARAALADATGDAVTA